MRWLRLPYARPAEQRRAGFGEATACSAARHPEDRAPDAGALIIVYAMDGTAGPGHMTVLHSWAVCVPCADRMEADLSERGR